MAHRSSHPAWMLGLFVALWLVAADVQGQESSVVGTYLCQHAVGPGACSFGPGTQCMRITSQCQSVQFVNPRLREGSVAISPVANATGQFNIGIYGSVAGAECFFGLFGPSEGGKNFAANTTFGQCNTFNVGPNTVDIDPVLAFSLEPSICTLCENFTLSAERQAALAVRSVCFDLVGKTACDADPECFWWGTKDTGCAPPYFATFLSSTDTVCSFVDNAQDCPRFLLCKWDEGSNACLTKSQVTEVIIDAIWFFDSTSQIRNRVVSPKSKAFDGIPNRFLDCSFHTEDGFRGLRFRGWEYVEFPGPLEERQSRYFYDSWFKPEADILLYPEATSGRFDQNQSFLVVPHEVSDEFRSAGGASLGISVGRNGYAVYEYVPLTNELYPVIVQARDMSVGFHHLAVAVIEGYIHILMDTADSLRNSSVTRSSLTTKPHLIGENSFGSFKGVIDRMQYRVANDVPTIVNSIIQEASLLTKSCKFSPPAIPSVTAGARFVLGTPFLTSNDAEAQQFSYTSTNIPATLRLNATSGVIFGIISSGGNFTFDVFIQGQSSLNCNDDVFYTISVLPPVSITSSSEDFPSQSTVTARYVLETPSVVGGTGVYTFAALNLPPGLVTDDASGVISGNPTESGDFNITVIATDENGGTDSVFFMLSVARAIAFKATPIFGTQGAFISISAPEADGGVSLSGVARRATSDRLRFKYSLDPSSDEVPGLTMDTIQGVYAGVPNATGIFTVVIRISDIFDAAVRDQTILEISGAIVVSALGSTQVAQAEQFEEFTLRVPHTVSGGRPPLRYVAQDLPEGLSIDSITGVVSGRPSRSGPQTFRVLVQDGNGAQQVVAVQSLAVAPASSSDRLSSGSIAAICACSVLAVLLILALLWNKKPQERPHDFTNTITNIFAEHSEGKKTPRELNRNDIAVVQKMGAGAFEEVFKATLDERKSGTPSYLVAVKTLKAESSAKERADLFAEAVIMANVEHKHLVGIIGVVTKGEPVMLVMQFMEHGSLDNFLRTHVGVADLSDPARMKIARDICSGMSFMSLRGYVHRDLAARNVLLDSSFTCKVADFGFTRELENDKEYYTNNAQNQIPVRWMAPEVLNERKFRTQSDVWSFGVTMYEIWTSGALPYDGMNAMQVWVKVCAGARLPRPPRMSDPIHSIMRRCLSHAAENRPSFVDLETELSNMLRNEADVLDELHKTTKMSIHISETPVNSADQSNTNKHGGSRKSMGDSGVRTRSHSAGAVSASGMPGDHLNESPPVAPRIRSPSPGKYMPDHDPVVANGSFTVSDVRLGADTDLNGVGGGGRHAGQSEIFSVNGNAPAHYISGSDLQTMHSSGNGNGNGNGNISGRIARRASASLSPIPQLVPSEYVTGPAAPFVGNGNGSINGYGNSHAQPPSQMNSASNYVSASAAQTGTPASRAAAASFRKHGYISPDDVNLLVETSVDDHIDGTSSPSPVPNHNHHGAGEYVTTAWGTPAPFKPAASDTYVSFESAPTIDMDAGHTESEYTSFSSARAALNTSPNRPRSSTVGSDATNNAARLGYITSLHGSSFGRAHSLPMAPPHPTRHVSEVDLANGYVAESDINTSAAKAELDAARRPRHTHAMIRSPPTSSNGLLQLSEARNESEYVSLI